MSHHLFKDIKGKKVLITGGSGGIGSAMVELFAGFGAIVGIHYHRDKDKAERALATVTAAGGRGAIFEADLLIEDERAELIGQFTAAYGGLDVLINNAGGPIGNDQWSQIDIDSWRKTFSLNTEAPFYLSAAAWPALKAGGGRIINISSIAAKYGGSDSTIHYAAAKAALETITVALAKRGAADGILVNSIRPGAIDTDFHKIFKRATFEARTELIPLGRLGRPEEVAQMALYLASKSADFITGQVFSVTGGE